MTLHRSATLAVLPPSLRPWLVLALALLAALPARAAGYTVEDGTIGQAKYTIVSPAKWNGKLLLLAHGLRPEDAPITSEFDYGKGTLPGELLKEGWIVASTSFRRNGWILSEAADDVAALRDKVVSVHGNPATTIVLGTSMGGAIATVLAERSDHKAYQGILAVSAALGAETVKGLSHTPQVPLLFLSNQNEAGAPRDYVQAASNGPAVPALWTVARDGHVNITEAELTEAVHGLLKYIETGKIEPNKDVTIPEAAPASTATFDGAAALGTVTAVDAVYGNITTDFVAADLEKIGAKPGARLAIRSGTKAVEAPWVKAYADVPQGDFLAFVTAEGRVLVARNMANAAQELGVKPGDKIGVSAVKP